MREDTKTEFKREYTEDIRREIIAFANTQGGTIYVGIEDDGTICGVADPDDVMLRIVGCCRDSVHPDVMMFLQCETEEREGRRIVAVHVQPGTSKPYFIASKGLRPAGVFVRQGTAAAPASEAAIRQMIRDSDGESYEMMRSLEQRLTFEEAVRVFRECDFEFGPAQMRSLGLVSRDGVYTNLGLLLSDQCPHIIKAAYFRTKTQEEFQDRKEFSGSLFRQMRDAYEYLDLLNKTRATFSGLYRTDTRDYPENAVREALMNAIVHRDYGRSASTLISIYEDRMEMVSVGGLPQDVEVDDIFMGLSVCRNPRLAEIFYRLKLIEAYGTGIAKIWTAYGKKLSVFRTQEDQEIISPEIQTSSHAFRITLPNRNTDREEVGRRSTNREDLVREKSNYGSRSAGEDYEARTRKWFDTHEEVTRPQLEEYLGVSLSTANRVLKAMESSGEIVCCGHGKNTRYVRKGNPET